MIVADLETLVATVLAVLALLGTVLLLRRALILRSGAVVACALRRDDKAGWQGGVARFDPDALRAYRLRALAVRPYVELSRAEFSLGERRAPEPGERDRLMHDPVVLCVRSRDDRLELALGNDALLGLLAWVEGRPVG